MLINSSKETWHHLILIFRW